MFLSFQKEEFKKVVEGQKRKVVEGTEEIEQQYWYRGNNQAASNILKEIEEL